MSWLGAWSWIGAIAGLWLGIGLALIYLGLPANRVPGIEARIAPYLRDALAPSQLLHRMPSNVSWGARAAGPIIGDLARWVERLMGGSASVRRRLQRAGLAPDVEAFRAEQVLWGLAGGLLGTVLGMLAVVTRGANPIAAAGLVVSAALVGIIARDQWLSHQADTRERRMLIEFPTVAELLALAVSAGEGATGALDRVCRLSRGELATELGRCLADARAGANLPTALQGLADRTALMSLSRFVDGMVVAVERGTPLAEVLRAQAQDVRESGRRAVMEAGGRKEIAMMVPVVFLVLPVTVLFAVFPGVAFLRLSM
ncbi:MAG: type II secretion system F family protein [Candidatus Phosphoribacter sp.]|nr:type II secretion system F family protein [Actinomycetales bacterium]